MKQLSPLTRYRLRLVLQITAFWVVVGILIEINNALIYDPVRNDYFWYFAFGNNPLEHLLITTVGPLLGGILVGTLIIFVLREKLQRHSFVFKQLLQSAIFLCMIFVFIMLVGAIQALMQGDSFFRTFIDVVFNLRVLRLVVTWLVVVFITLLILEVIEKYGPSVLWKIINGKYHRPVTEERIIMFMDLTDSTGHAERLGEEKYFRLLRSLYFIMTEPVLNAEGEIYQYVGDEIIVSWSVKAGLRNANCIQCFFRIEQTIEKNKENFIREFGIVPVFKAAVHKGSVVIGEIGVIKKDIVYAGDVLNSAARIRDLSKQYGEQLLVSDVIYDELKADHRFTFQFLDALVLRGKTTESKIYGVRLIRNA